MNKEKVLMTSVGYYVSVWKDENNPTGVYEIMAVLNEPNAVTYTNLHEIGSMIEESMRKYEKDRVSNFENLIEEIEKICPYGVQLLINPNYYKI